MKYQPAPLTPFLAPLPENPHPFQIDPSQIATTPPKLNSSDSYCSELFVVAKKLNSFAINQIRTRSQEHPGWGYRADLLFTGHESRVTGHVFSITYKSLPPTCRFASPAFSSTYKSLFSQILSFHIYTNCPGVTPPVACSVVSVPSAFSVLNSLLLAFFF
jgi:hypothetical protein